MLPPPSAARLPLLRLFLIAAVLPACCVGLDHWLLVQQQTRTTDIWLSVLTLTVYVVQIGVLGALCARLIEPSWLRWTIYLWCWVLIDLQTLTAWSDSVNNYSPVSMLSSSLFAAQLGMAVIWAVLGAGRWAIRLPLTLAVASLFAAPLLGLNDMWGYDQTQLFLAQIVTLLAICGFLRWQGFRLGWAGSQTAANASAAQLPSSQFGIRDVLTWMTSLAFLLAVLRAFDWLAANQFAGYGWNESLALISAGAILAMALVAALWAALGDGKVGARWTCLAVACLGGGVAYFLEHQLFGRYGVWTSQSYFRQYRSAWEYWYSEFTRDWWRVAWVALAGGLLFAALLFLRGLDYRMRRPVPEVQTGASSAYAR